MDLLTSLVAGIAISAQRRKLSAMLVDPWRGGKLDFSIACSKSASGESVSGFFQRRRPVRSFAGSRLRDRL